MFTRQTLVGKCSVRNLLYWGTHISLNPVSKADGILAKIFIYNILQQRLDRLLLAVLRRKRGRRVHEWGCRSGSGSAGRSAGEELRTRQQGENIKNAEGEDSTCCAQAKAGTCATLGS